MYFRDGNLKKTLEQVCSTE